jgi:hypothetical protein
MMGALLQLLLESDTDISSSPREHAVSNALLHAFLISTRNLCHFLYSHKPRTTDIIGEDFFDDPVEWKRVRPSPPTEFADGTFVNRISKRLAHLTWDRIAGTKPTWGVFRVAWELSKALEAFVSNVRACHLSREIGEDVTVLVQVLAAYVEEFGSPDDVKGTPLSTLWEEEGFWMNLRAVEPDDR